MPRQTHAAHPSAVRIDARIPAHVKESIALAATLQGRTQTDFMIAALSEAAQKTIAEQTVIRLCIEDQKALAAALLENDAKAPRKESPRLRKALKEYRSAVKSGRVKSV